MNRRITACSPWGLSKISMQPTRHESYACCLLHTELLTLVGSTHDSRVERVAYLFPWIPCNVTGVDVTTCASTLAAAAWAAALAARWLDLIAERDGTAKRLNRSYKYSDAEVSSSSSCSSSSSSHWPGFVVALSSGKGTRYRSPSSTRSSSRRPVVFLLKPAHQQPPLAYLRSDQQGS